MGIKIYNSLTRKKEDFHPLQKNKISIYLCGPTVYDYFHIGNGRTFMVFDVYRRFLEYRGFDVTFVSNITDVDDKLIAKSIQSCKPVSEIAQFFTEAYLEDCEALRIRKADFIPLATEYVVKMIDMVKLLIEKGYAYEVDGDVFYNVMKFSGYGELSGKNIDELDAGHRVEIDSRKKNPADFALWKSAKPEEISWDSPWGKGRPGWHLECSVMSHDRLGSSFDIHCGGEDLIFPHHENERAQSIACHGGEFARYWMHARHLNFGTEKMSKSLGNIINVRDLLKEYSAESVRIFFLQKHYRQRVVFEVDLLKDTEIAAERIARTIDRLTEAAGENGHSEQSEPPFPEVVSAEEKVIAAMEDDFNSPEALAAVFEMVRFANSYIDTNSKDEDFKKNAGQILGFFRRIDTFLGIIPAQKPHSEDDLIQVMDLLLRLRKKLREEKNWAFADEIRNGLDKIGITVEDGKDGSRWHKKK